MKHFESILQNDIELKSLSQELIKHLSGQELKALKNNFKDNFQNIND